VLEGGLNATLHAEGVIDILDFEFYPWGNAYFAQEDCYGYPNYDRNYGYPCWQEKCGVANAPAECFEGTILCQHGDDECSVNLIEGCTKSLYPDVLTYMDFAGQEVRVRAGTNVIQLANHRHRDFTRRQHLLAPRQINASTPPRLHPSTPPRLHASTP